MASPLKGKAKPPTVGTGGVAPGDLDHEKAMVQAVKKAKAKKPRRITPQTRARMDEITGMLSMMVPQHTIEKNLAQKWGVRRNYVAKLVSQVRLEWRHQVAALPDYPRLRRDQLRTNWEHLYMKAMKDGDLKTCAMCLRELGNLDGAYAPKELNVNGQFTGVGLSISSLGFTSPDDVRERIEEIRQRIEDKGPMSIAKLQGSQVIDVDGEEK